LTYVIEKLIPDRDVQQKVSSVRKGRLGKVAGVGLGTGNRGMEWNEESCGDIGAQGGSFIGIWTRDKM